MAVAVYLLVVVLTCGGIATSEAVLITKTACEAQCGSVSIPYPFGIGSNCSLDKWFEIVCDKSTNPPRIFLKHTQLEVVNISYADDYLGASVQVRNPISFFNCPDKKTRKPLNLKGSPFLYSNYNKFVSVNCGDLAMMESLDNKFWVGCKSTCSTHNTTGNSKAPCSDDIACCQTFIPTRVYSYDISLYNYSTTEARDDATQNRSCNFAFLVDRNYLSRYENTSTSHFISTIRDMDYVPVTLSLELNRSYFDITKTITPSKTMASIVCFTEQSTDDNSFSYLTEITTLANQTRISHCICGSGFRGNPYLIDGCQDINECEEKISECRHGSTCENTYGSYHCSERRKYVLIGICSALGALVLLFGAWGLYRVIKKRKEIKRKKRFFKQNGGLLFEQEMSSRESNVEKTKLFKSYELEKATNNFSTDRILGQGGQGTVYKGMLEDGKIVAIKKSIIIDESKLSEFINEVVILSQINHRNVVKLLGCCLETEVPLLVYEFIPNGTLSQYIHNNNDDFPLTWKIRVRIATEVAGPLSYLHSAACFPIYHRDIKSTNILLDAKFRAKVADFGTSRSISIEQTHLTTLVCGTFGYLDPEYFQSGQFTEKSDVYSFGVVLIELLTGQKAISMTRSEEGRSLATYFRMTMEEDGLFDILDGQVLEDAPKEEIIKVADIAHRCLHMSGRNRPTMKEVAKELEGIQTPNVGQNYEELDYGRTEHVEPLDVVSASTWSALDITVNTPTRALLLHELPQLSFESSRSRSTKYNSP